MRYPKWMLYNEQSQCKVNDLGVPVFQDPSGRRISQGLAADWGVVVANLQLETENLGPHVFLVAPWRKTMVKSHHHKKNNGYGNILYGI